MMTKQTYQPGQPVVYRVLKHSQRPGPRAHDIFPAPMGETYRYQVDKFWVVEAVHDDSILVVRTRRGKVHQLHSADPNLRHATWWEVWWYSDRFPQLSQLNV